ncbi:hypothetical protein F2Q70_00014643 [Brassica cretica]|uniref:C2H2-type domain-containing protein n=1 Tax=Brassica cretica TaxID=69181 RepID=A0A8S9HV30_BRACR|nr:hypothetical protein F2Q70_00014643 [Brassica cretica]
MNNGEGSMPCFSETTITSSNHLYPMTAATKSSEEDHSISLSLLLNLSTIQDKVHHIQSLVSFFMISNNNQSSESTSSLAVANIESLVHEIVTAATSMMLTCQQRHIPSNNNSNFNNEQTDDAIVMKYSTQETEPDHDFTPESSTNFLGVQERGNISFIDHNLDWHGTQSINPKKDQHRFKTRPGNYEILELGADDLLAKFTHHCQICGKGFKRDANLRMHMRAHGDEWNQRHEKFQPLKSVICAKNHYKRSHCPKMYMCRRCNVKHFSVLSDLRTHEKHCGEIKWVCSCGTTFSRKDKLMSHVSLFVGHSPVHGPPPPQRPIITI